MNAPMVCLHRMGAQVHVGGDLQAIDWVRKRGRLYFDFEETPDREGVWRIIAGHESAPSLRWQTCNRGYSGAPCTFLFSLDHRTVVIDAPPGPWRQLWTLRLVRDLLRWQLFHAGAIFIHASVVARGSKGIALLGRSRSGKSTILLQLLRDSGLCFVAEDDLTLVRKSDGTLVALGWPACLRIRRGMLNYFPEFADISNFTHPDNNQNARDSESDLLRLFPEEVAARLESSVVPEATLDAVVSLQWAKESDLSVLSPRSIANALIDAWDILPERRPGTRPQLNCSTQDWRTCCFNPPLFDFFGVRENLTTADIQAIASEVAGYRFCHNGDATHIHTLLKS